MSVLVTEDDKVSAYKTALDAAKARIQKVEKLLAMALTQNANLQQSEALATSRVDKALRECNKALIAAEEAKTAQVQAQVDKEDAVRNLGARTYELMQVRSELAQEKAARQAAEARPTADPAEVARLTAELAMANASLKLANTEVVDSGAKIAQQTAALALARDAVKAAEARATSAERERDVAKGEVATKSTEIGTLQRQLAAELAKPKRPASFLGRFEKGPERNRTLLTAACAVVALLLAVIFGIQLAPSAGAQVAEVAQLLNAKVLEAKQEASAAKSAAEVEKAKAAELEGLKATQTALGDCTRTGRVFDMRTQACIKL